MGKKQNKITTYSLIPVVGMIDKYLLRHMTLNLEHFQEALCHLAHIPTSRIREMPIS